MSDIDYVHELAESHKALNEAGWEIDRLRAEVEKLRAEVNDLRATLRHCLTDANFMRAAAAAYKETGE